MAALFKLEETPLTKCFQETSIRDCLEKEATLFLRDTSNKLGVKELSITIQVNDLEKLITVYKLFGKRRLTNTLRINTLIVYEPEDIQSYKKLVKTIIKDRRAEEPETYSGSVKDIVLWLDFINEYADTLGKYIEKYRKLLNMEKYEYTPTYLDTETLTLKLKRHPLSILHEIVIECRTILIEDQSGCVEIYGKHREVSEGEKNVFIDILKRHGVEEIYAHIVVQILTRKLFQERMRRYKRIL